MRHTEAAHAQRSRFRVCLAMATPLKADRVAEITRTLICERLLREGYHRDSDPVWLARLLVARVTLRTLLERLQRR